MSSLTTDFNVSPYFDDFDEANKYYRILFRPSVPVQARELTQSQTILQNQVTKFGDHVFKDGSVVDGCNPTTISNFDFVRVENLLSYANGLTVATPDISTVNSSFLLVGNTSNVRAVALVTKVGFKENYLPNNSTGVPDSDDNDTNRFYVKYLTTGVNDETTFANGEYIKIYTSSQEKLSTINGANFYYQAQVVTPNATMNAVGKGYGLRIEDGVVYHKGFFQNVDDQTIVVKPYDQNVGNYAIGFETTESIVTENQDSSLLDNALGYSNENAPGAHRLKLVPTIVAKDKSTIGAEDDLPSYTATNDKFFSVFEFSNVTGELLINKAKDSYDKLGQVLDERTYEESGDYVVTPFITETLESDDANTFYYQVSPGKGYVHGSRVEFLAANKTEVSRAITTAGANDQIITINYGNYVLVDECVGALNFANMVTVDVYSNNFYAITNNYTYSISTGSKIGTAKVRAVMHHSGNPGTNTSIKRIYLTDIQMNSGYSFYRDAKALYANNTVNSPYPNAVFDIYHKKTSTNAAILEGSSKIDLIFPFGKKALKRLRDVGGGNDTEFTFRVTTTDTLYANGLLVTSLPAASPGAGSETVGYAALTALSETQESQMILTLSESCATSNLSTNCAVTLGSNVITFEATASSVVGIGEFVTVYETAGSQKTGRILAITGTNTANVKWESSIGTTNANAKFYKNWPAGYIIPLVSTDYPSTRTATVDADPAKINILTGVGNTTLSLTTTPTVISQYKAVRTSATQAKKDVNKDVYVRINTATNAGGNNGPWDLGFADVFRIKNVYANTTDYSNSSVDDVTDRFTLDTGQRDDFYEHSKLILNPQYINTVNNSYLTVVFDCFTPNTTAGIGFFSVDSYPTVNGTPTSTTINWAEIPTYTSGSTNYDLRDCVDFRSYKANTAALGSNTTNSTENPAVSSSFIVSTVNHLAEPDSNFEADVEYYLGRTDLVVINTSGGLGVVQGMPSESPTTPQVDSDAMTICTAFIPPFPSLTTREAESYGRLDYSIRTSANFNRGYTMRDIGVLDQRIQRLEYYVTLNMLEQKAKDLKVTDASGFDRFKNGFFADPMNSHALGRVDDIEYRWSIDSGEGFGRPMFCTENVDLTFDSTASPNIIQRGSKIMKNILSHELYIQQPFCTKYRNCTQDVWSWKGTVDLFPPYDMNRDEKRAPNVDAKIDLTQPFLQFANAMSRATNTNIFGTRYGDWRTTDRQNKISSNIIFGRGFGVVTNTVKTTENQRRTVSNTYIVPVKDTINLGKFITDVSVQPYMKSRTVAFIARNLKPNTKIYAFFDDVAVSQYCAPGTLNTALGPDESTIAPLVLKSGKLDSIVKRTAAFGTQLRTDSLGRLYGVFLIPEGKFRTGDRQFQLLDINNLLTGADAAITKASAIYTASNISITSKNATLTTIKPEIRVSSFTENRIVTKNTVQQIVFPTGLDPIAQSFRVVAPQGQSGVFVTKLRLFFQAKDANRGIRVVIVGMDNGYPDSSKVYGWSKLPPTDGPLGINVSANGYAASEFIFNPPIYLAANKDYAFYVEPEANSPEYRMWMCETGGKDTLTGAQVFSNPYIGDAFRSSNSKTWSVIPKEDVKFRLYVANFQVGTHSAVFTNEADEYITYNNLAFLNGESSLQAGDEIWTVNSASNTTILDTSKTAILQEVDVGNSKMKFDSSTGGFANNTTIAFYRLPEQGNSSQANSTTIVGTATLNKVYNPALHAICPRFATITPVGTSIDISFSGRQTGGTDDIASYDLINDDEREMLDYERAVFSKSNEGASKSLTIYTDFTNTNKYVTPVIDLNRKSALVIENIISPTNISSTTGEANTRLGGALSKYVSQLVRLADGQDAEDIKVYVSGYRPYNTDIEVFVKFQAASDPESFDTKVWTKLVNNSDSLRSSPIDLTDFKEFEYSMPTSVPATNPTAAISNTTNAGILEYRNAANAIFQTFKTFSVKVVLTSNNRILVPKVDDLRAIALQV